MLSRHGRGGVLRPGRINLKLQECLTEGSGRLLLIHAMQVGNDFASRNGIHKILTRLFCRLRREVVGNRRTEARGTTTDQRAHTVSSLTANVSAQNKRSPM